MNKKIRVFCFTHYDLDGVVSALVLKWFLSEAEIGIMPLGSVAKRNDVQKWLLVNNFADYDKIFFLDLDTSDIADIIDFKNVIIIDHHKSHEQNLTYKNAKVIVKEYSSACLLTYKSLCKITNKTISENQKKLIVYGDDYDSYKHQFPESRLLNMLFWGNQNAFNTFIESFYDGFRKFTREEINIIKIYSANLSETIKGLEIYKGKYTDDKKRDIIAISGESTFPNEVSDYILQKYKPDMCIMINIKTGHVGLRRKVDGDMNLMVFAEKFLNGGGHEYSAGGSITEDFLGFLKTLYLYEV